MSQTESDVTADGPKPGWATTEFWLALVPIVMAVLALICSLTHHAVPDVNGVTKLLTEVGSVVATAYVLGRSILKAVNAHGNAKVAATYAAVLGPNAVTPELIAETRDLVASANLALRGATLSPAAGSSPGHTAVVAAKKQAARRRNE